MKSEPEVNPVTGLADVRCAAWGRWIGIILARVYWRTKIQGADNVPKTGAAILVANHVSIIDGPVVMGAVPRHTHFMVKREMFKGIFKPILEHSGQIPVEGSGREALAAAVNALKGGRVVGIFPEGTRGNGAADSVHGGAAWLAVSTGAPVVPVALLGTRLTGESVNVWPRPGRRILVEFGVPFVVRPPEGMRGRLRQQWAEDFLAENLRKHLTAVASTSDIALPTDEPLRDKENNE